MYNKLLLVFSTLTPLSVWLIGILAIFAPIKAMMEAVLFLIAMDNITGIMVSYKVTKTKFRLLSWKSWSHITSKGIGDTISKTLVYMILIICGFVIDTYIIVNPEEIYFTKFLAASVALREIKSLIENGEIILGGGLISLSRAFLKGGWKGGINNLFKDKDNDRTRKNN